MSAVAFDWNGWRDEYPRMTFEAARAWNDAVAVEYPDQRHYDAPAITEFVNATGAVSVVDFGGWDGALAAEVLPLAPLVGSWETWDISLLPQACEDPRYSTFTPDGWIWNQPPRRADLLVASHTLEHLTEDQIRAFFARHTFEHVFVDVPMTDAHPRWVNSTTMHILEMSAPDLAELICLFGYELVTSVCRPMPVGDCTLMTFRRVV